MWLLTTGTGVRVEAESVVSVMGGGGDVGVLLPICSSLCVQLSGPHLENYGAFLVVLSPVALLLLSVTMGPSINETNTLMS